MFEIPAIILYVASVLAIALLVFVVVRSYIKNNPKELPMDEMEGHDFEYYCADLIGLKIVDEDGKELGTLSEILQTGANDVYEVQLPDGGRILLPAIKECILNVDMEERIILVHLMKGL